MLNTLDDRPPGKLGKPTTCTKPIWINSFKDSVFKNLDGVVTVLGNGAYHRQNGWDSYGHEADRSLISSKTPKFVCLLVNLRSMQLRICKTAHAMQYLAKCLACISIRRHFTPEI